jgi:hypothetical protein
MSLLKKAEKLMELRSKITKMEEEQELMIAPLKEARMKLQDEIQEEMKKSGQFSARFDFGTITRAVRKTLHVSDNQKLVAHLKEIGRGDVISEVPNDYFKTLSALWVKRGEVPEGTEIVEKEYISIREGSDKEEKRKVKVGDFQK